MSQMCAIYLACTRLQVLPVADPPFAVPGAGVVLLDKHFLRAKWPMWELGVMMAALPDNEQPRLTPQGRQHGPCCPWC